MSYYKNWKPIVSGLKSLKNKTPLEHLIPCGHTYFILKNDRRIIRLDSKITGLPHASIGKTASKSWKIHATDSFEGKDEIKQLPLSAKWNLILSSLEKEFALALLNRIGIDEPSILEES